MLSHLNNALLQHFSSVLQTRFPAMHRCILGHQARKGNMDTWKRTCKKTLSLSFSALTKNHNKVGSSSTSILWFSFLCCHRCPTAESWQRWKESQELYSNMSTWVVLFTSRNLPCPFWSCQSSEALSILLSTSRRLHQPLQLAADFFIW